MTDRDFYFTGDPISVLVAILAAIALTAFGSALADINVLLAIGINLIVVGGGVFNRAYGLAEEIGADLWAGDPLELVQVMNECPQRRMTGSQRTVGRKRRPASRVAAA